MLQYPLHSYERALSDVLTMGDDIPNDRTGVGCRYLPGVQMRYDMRHGSFPLITSKTVYFRLILTELLWFLSGSTDIRELRSKNNTIWDEWAPKDGYDMGPVYGKQWRSFGEVKDWQGDFVQEAVGYEQGGYENRPNVRLVRKGIDQISQVQKDLRENPFSRRHLVTAWNPHDVPNMALPCCHCLFQFSVAPGPDGTPHYLDCNLYQRSGDMFLGVPFNLASYSLLTCIMARATGLWPRYMIHTIGHAHIYANHFDQVQEQLSRDLSFVPLPKWSLPGYDASREKFDTCLEAMRFGPNGLDWAWTKSILDPFIYAINDRVVRSDGSLSHPGYIAHPERILFRIDGYKPHPPIEAPVAV